MNSTLRLLRAAGNKPVTLNNVLRQAALIHRTRGGGSNLYNRTQGNIPELYVEHLYEGIDEGLDTVPHSSDGGHPLFPRFAEATCIGKRPYDLEDPLAGFQLYMWIYGVFGIFMFCHMLKYWDVWKHLFETLTLQYTYEREIGQEYFWQWGGGSMHPSKATWVKNPLEELGIITEYRTDLDYPDDY